MINLHDGDAVIVGIDGSAAAIYAAHWAVEEAKARDVPLRLVSCTPRTEESDRMATEYAATCLRAAHAAIEDTGQQVKIETAIVDGRPAAALIEASQQASMVCVGSVGIGRFAKALLGSTADELAEDAMCPVAVIRSYIRRQQWPRGSIAAEMNDGDNNDLVIATAVAEAQLRMLPVIIAGVCPPTTGLSARDELTRRAAIWQRRYPAVSITATPIATSFIHFLREPAESISLVVIGNQDSADLPSIIGAHTDVNLGNPSVLIARP